MSGTHSSTLAEERLHPSVQAHKSTTAAATAIPAKDPFDGPQLHCTTAGEGPGKVEPLGAFEVARSTRLLQIAVAVVYCLLAAGVVFGYAALKPILIAEGVYRDYCTPEEEREGVRVCIQQEIRLNLMFTVAAVATNVCALLVGTILDQWGPRVAGIIGSMLFALGTAGFAMAKSITFIDPYPISYLLMAVGGPFIFIPSFHLANAFPRHSGLILSMLTGAFDSSSAIFLLYRMLYQSTSGALSLRKWFSFYLVVPVFILSAQLLLMPRQSYKTASELVQQAEVESDLIDRDSIYDDHSPARRERREQRENILSEIGDLLDNNPDASSTSLKNQHEKHQFSKVDTSGVWGAMHGRPVTQQLSTFWFWGIAGFTIVQMTRINYFVATVRPQYEFLLHSYDASVQINTFFDVALPLGGLAAIPFIGLVLDSLSTLTVLSLLVTIATSIGIAGLVENSYLAAYANIILFVAYRPFYYTVVSDFCVKVFGVATFGKVYGSVICLAGMFNFCAAALDKVTFGTFRGDPRPVNALLLALAVGVGGALIMFVRGHGRKVRRKMLGDEARNAREELLWGQSNAEGYGAV